MAMNYSVVALMMTHVSFQKVVIKQHIQQENNTRCKDTKQTEKNPLWQRQKERSRIPNYNSIKTHSW